MPQLIEIRNAETGVSFEWPIPDELWLDLQAFAAAANLTIEQVIHDALAAFFKHRPETGAHDADDSEA